MRYQICLNGLLKHHPNNHYTNEPIPYAPMYNKYFNFILNLQLPQLLPSQWVHFSYTLRDLFNNPHHTCTGRSSSTSQHCISSRIFWIHSFHQFSLPHHKNLPIDACIKRRNLCMNSWKLEFKWMDKPWSQN